MKNKMKKRCVKILTVVFCMITLVTALIVPISATEKTTENDVTTFSITEGNQGTGVYTDLREMVNCTVYPDDINTTNIEERDNSNYYYELSLPVGTVVPWEYFSDMRKGSTYFDGKGKPSAIRAVVGYTLGDSYFRGMDMPSQGYQEPVLLESGRYYDGFEKLYVYTVSATDPLISDVLKYELTPEASFYFIISRVDRNSIGSTQGLKHETQDYIAFPCTKTGDDYVIGQAYRCFYGLDNINYGSDYLPDYWYLYGQQAVEIVDNRIELWGWQTYNLDGTYTNISDSFYFKLNPSVLGLFKVLDGRTVPYTYLQLIQSYGYDEGYSSGHSEGFDDGLQQGRKNWYQSRYDKGYADAEEVHKNDWANGFGAGQNDMAETTQSFKDMVFAIFDAPVTLIDGMLGFEIFGINMAGLVKTIITLAVVALIVFVILKFAKG